MFNFIERQKHTFIYSIQNSYIPFNITKNITKDVLHFNIRLYVIVELYWAFLYILLQKAANGQVTSEKTSPAKKTLTAKAEAPKKAARGDDVDGKLKERKQEDNKIVATKKEKEQPSTKAGKENKVEQTKNKKNLKNLFQEKPVDFDDGWLIYIY